MKKITLMLALAFGLNAMAQYHEINWQTLGANPREGNDEPEQTWGFLNSNYTGWSQIHASGASTWSSAQTIPFAFQFNGSAATSFYVHPNGLVTFSPSPSAISSMPSSLPSANIPDKTVSLIGININGANDAVIQKTFGTAPYRQHWIMWSSASSSTSTVNWTYWSVVLEESTNHIYIVDQRTYGGNVSLLAGVQVSSSQFTAATGYPSLNSVTQATSGNGDDPSDNKIYAFVPDPSSTPTNDVAGQKVTTSQYLAVNTSTAISGEFVNYGTNTVNSLKIAYSVDGGAAQNATITGLNATTGQRVAFATASSQYTPTTIGTKNLKIWFSEINGNSDLKNFNDTIYGTINVLNSLIQRQVLAEEFTSSTCGPCASFNPGYNAILDANNVNTPNGKVNAVKYQMNWPSPGTDPNYNPDGVTRRGFYGINGVPTPLLDGIDGLYTQTDIDNLYQTPASMSIGGEWNVSGTTMTVDVEVTPENSVNNPNLKLFIAVVEKTLNASSYPGGTVTNGESVFHQVMRKMLPDGNGDALGALTAGNMTTKTHSYQFTMGGVAQGNHNLWSNFTNIDVVAWIQDISTKEVLQSAVIQGNSIGVDELVKHYDFSIFPNPAYNMAYVSLTTESDENATISIVNTMGQVISESNVQLESGSNAIPLNLNDLANGVYLVRVQIGNSVITQKLSVR